MLLEKTTRGAVISDCGVYRYLLWREAAKENAGACCFIMLNPSTADADRDDPTIRRCIRFTKDWGYRWLYVVNLFAFRATNPEKLKTAVKPIGPQNDEMIVKVLGISDLAVAAWGSHGRLFGRDHRVKELLLQVPGKQLHHLGLGGEKPAFPKHPLYLRADTKPIPWVFRWAFRTDKPIGE